MAFLESMNVFEGEDEFAKRVEKSTLGEADRYLAEMTKTNGRVLSPYERAVVLKHHGDVFSEDDSRAA